MKLCAERSISQSVSPYEGARSQSRLRDLQSEFASRKNASSANGRTRKIEAALQPESVHVAMRWLTHEKTRSDALPSEFEASARERGGEN